MSFSRRRRPEQIEQDEQDYGQMVDNMRQQMAALQDLATSEEEDTDEDDTLSNTTGGVERRVSSAIPGVRGAIIPEQR